MVTFAHAIACGQATVVSGTGSVSGSTITTANDTVTIDLTGVGNAQTILVKLPSVHDGTTWDDIFVPMHVLVGDVNSNGAVNGTDKSATKLHAGEATAAGNFRMDVNASGTITATDASIIGLYSGTSLPNPPPPGPTAEVSYEYDADGRVTRLYLPPDYDFTQTYDSLGRLEKIFVTGNADPLDQYTYDEASNVTQRTNSGGATIVFTPDELNRIKEVNIHVPSQEIPQGTQPRTVFTHEHYIFDGMNRLTQTSRDEDARADQFAYNDAGEPKSAKYGLIAGSSAAKLTSTCSSG